MEYGLQIKFHLVLVKFAQKPSLYIGSSEIEEILLSCEKFVDFIDQDDDLEMGFFATLRAY